MIKLRLRHLQSKATKFNLQHSVGVILQTIQQEHHFEDKKNYRGSWSDFGISKTAMSLRSQEKHVSKNASKRKL